MFGRLIALGGMAAAVLAVGLAVPEPARVAAVASGAMPAAARTQADRCSEELVVDRSMTLDPSCTYKTIRIVKSDVVLDCAGAVIDVDYRARYGLIIAPRKFGEIVRNVVVKNCTVKRARRHGVYIGIEGCDRNKLSVDEAERYRIHPQAIRIENVTVQESANSGLYIDDYVQNVTVTGSRFERNASVGIYITHDARRNLVEHSHFERNGYGEEITPRAKGRREAIAIDSAQENRIVHNVFRDNYAGAVFLYRNCWEAPTAHCSVERMKGASHNIIADNDIEGGLNGIWIAARQRINTDKPSCGRKPDPARGIYNDDAKNNQVMRNTIRRSGFGIVAEDDGNNVADNIIEHPHKACIIVGSERRISQFGAPVRGLQVTGNSCRIGNRAPDKAGILLVPGTEASITNNKISR